MTQQNWASMVNKNISGNLTCTCLVAALDCLMEHRSIPARVYAEIESAYLEQQLTGLSPNKIEEVISLLSRYVNGVSNYNKIRELLIEDLLDFIWMLDEAVRLNKYILINTEFRHVVGLKPRENNLWEMVGIGVPTRRFLTPKEIWPFVLQPDKDLLPDYRTNAILADKF